jgi:formate hydrogenlyase subunit 3/multisubunit Na+/H+ antiporter MnhD subunit
MIVRNHIKPIFKSTLYSKTKIRSLDIAKRISNVVIFISGAVIIASIITLVSVIRYEPFRIPAWMGWDYGYILEWKRYCVKLLLFSMIIPSIICILIFIPIGFILLKKLQIVESIYIKKEYGHSEDTFKLHRNSIS